MRAVYRIGYAAHPGEWIDKARLFELLDTASDSDNEALASFMVSGDLTSKEAKMRIGKVLTKFNGRHLDGTQMVMDDNPRSVRQRIMFRQPSGTTQLDLDGIFGMPGTTNGSPAPKSAPSPSPTEEQNVATLATLVTSTHGQKVLGNNSAKNKNKIEGIYYSHTDAIRTSDQSSQSDQPKVFCSRRTDLDRIALDLTGAERIALDIETYGPRKGDGLDPWKGDIRLLPEVPVEVEANICKTWAEK